MKSDDFWAVEVGVRVGPVVLGTEFGPLMQALRAHRIDVERLTLDRSGNVALPEIGMHLNFSSLNPRTLVRIDVSDERLRFGPLAVIGKRAHEIVGLFKVSRKETLWCNIESGDNAPTLSAQGKITRQLTPDRSIQSQSHELLAHGTIWLTSLGLGFTLRDGLVATLHLCDPAHSPRSGSGPWTKEQQRLSEVRELPPASLMPTQNNRGSISKALVHLVFLATLGALIWWAIRLQHRWDGAIEAIAVVVAVDPPPPNVLPTNITVQFNDVGGKELRQTLGHWQFLLTPQLGDEVSVRYLAESPEMVLGPVASRDVGFQSAFPYGMGILALYSIVQLMVSGRTRFRRRD